MSACQTVSDSLFPKVKVRAYWDKKTFSSLERELQQSQLTTVCQEAKCPNIGECWSAGTATIMLLGKVCTRFCKFCNVQTGNPRGFVDSGEPDRVALKIAKTTLQYIVLTCVDRDDLPDGGSWIFAQTIRAIREKKPTIHIESLISDYSGSKDSLTILLESNPDVVAHNIECVRELTPSVRDRRAGYDQSLSLLKRVKQLRPGTFTKSSIMVGLGETTAQLKTACKDLHDAKVDILTLGQYLRPSVHHHPVEKLYSQQEMEQLGDMAKNIGFSFVASGTKIRSSYKAAELFLQKKLSEKLG